MDVESLFGGMAKAQSTSRGQYMDEGKFRVSAKGFSVRKSQDPLKQGAVFFVFEFEILESSNPTAAPVGSTRSWLVNMGNAKALGNVKDLMLAFSGHEPKKVRPFEVDPTPHLEATEMAKVVCSPEYAAKAGADPNDLVGLELLLSCTKVNTRPKFPGAPAGQFTVHDWSPVPDAVNGGAF